MSIAGLIAGGIIVLVFLLYIAAPIFRHNNDAEINTRDVVARQRERLQVYYARVLRNLHDLDEDHATGKLSEDEYLYDREQWVQRGVQALQALDSLDAQHLVAPQESDDAEIDAAIDSVIESKIHEYRKEVTLEE